MSTAWRVSDGSAGDSIDDTGKKDQGMYSRIVVGTDGSDRSLIAVDHAARLAAAFAAELHVVAAASPGPVPPASPSTMPAALARLSDASAKTAAKIGHDASKRHGVRVIEHPQIGEPASVLMAIADAVDADLIVVGNKGMAGHIRKFTGSVPSRLAHQARRAVLIVHTG
jgi:nucleotide-binding universal stress UspA family protein